MDVFNQAKLNIERKQQLERLAKLRTEQDKIFHERDTERVAMKKITGREFLDWLKTLSEDHLDLPVFSIAYGQPDYPVVQVGIFEEYDSSADPRLCDRPKRIILR